MEAELINFQSAPRYQPVTSDESPSKPLSAFEPVRQKMGIPFGFSVSDIAKAIKISREIHDSCYSEDQGAGQSIHHLARPRRQVIDWLSSCYQLANVELVRTSYQVQRIHQ